MGSPVHQLASVTDPLNHSVNVTWTNGEATAVADGRGKQTAFAYNAYGERKSATDLSVTNGRSDT